MSVKTLSMYDANNTTLMINNIQIYGFQSGSNMVQASWDNDRVTVEVDSQGTPVPSKSNKDSMTITVNLNQQSPCNKLFIELASSNKPVPVDYRNSTEHWWGSEAYVTKPAESSDGDTASGRAWTIKVLHGNFEALEDGY